jgi:HrpA-like RNA helicase
MVRVPLDSVILSLREMLNEEVTPILLQCLEPPDISNIERSFESLYKSTFISSPDDSGEITTLGSLVVSLGIDLTLGSLVGLGIQFGVAPEAIELAAILSFPQSPWSIPNPLYQEPEQYNGEIYCVARFLNAVLTFCCYMHSRFKRLAHLTVVFLLL